MIHCVALCLLLENAHSGRFIAFIVILWGILTYEITSFRDGENETSIASIMSLNHSQLVNKFHPLDKSKIHCDFLWISGIKFVERYITVIKSFLRAFYLPRHCSISFAGWGERERERERYYYLFIPTISPWFMWFKIRTSKYENRRYKKNCISVSHKKLQRVKK